MPLDPNILLGAQGIQLPTPLDLATKGLTLAELSSRNQIYQNTIMQQQQLADATRTWGAGLAAGQDPDAIMSGIAQTNPLGYAPLAKTQRELEQIKADMLAKTAAAAKDRSEAFKNSNQVLANMAQGIVKENRAPTPFEQQELAARAGYVTQVAGADPSVLKIPPLGSAPELWTAWTKSMANGGILPKDRADMDLIYGGTLPKAIADTAKAQVETQWEPYKAQTGRISAQASASEAGAKWADLRAPKVELDAALRPVVLDRGIGNPYGPSVSAAQPAPAGVIPGTRPQGYGGGGVAAPGGPPGLGGGVGAAPPIGAPSGPPGVPAASPAVPGADQVSRQTGFGAVSPAAAPAAQNPNALGAPFKNVVEQIRTYRTAPPQRGTSPIGDTILDQVDELNKAEGKPLYDQSKWQLKDATVKAFAAGAPPGDQLRSNNVAISHMDLLEPMAKALNNRQNVQWNKFANRIAMESGSAVPTTFNAAAQIVGKELAKAYVAGGGGEAERDAILQTFNNAQSYDQIKGAIDKYQGLLGGAIAGLKQQYDAGVDVLKTGESDFDKFLTPETKTVLAKLQGASGGFSEKLPDPATLPEGAKVTENASGKKLKVHNGRYVPQ